VTQPSGNWQTALSASAGVPEKSSDLRTCGKLLRPLPPILRNLFPAKTNGRVCFQEKTVSLFRDGRELAA